MNVEPVTLEGRHVRLEPLTQGHAQAFCEAGREWGMTLPYVQESVAGALRQQEAGTALPFATVERAGGRVVGGTRFLHIDPDQRRLEIGSSWLAGPWRRTAINTEAKLLMLGHAFERLGCVRVAFMADARNEVSRRAILRLGATEEGTFRNYLVGSDGPHAAVFYSVIGSEWPDVKARLERMLAR